MVKIYDPTYSRSANYPLIKDAQQCYTNIIQHVLLQSKHGVLKVTKHNTSHSSSPTQTNCKRMMISILSKSTQVTTQHIYTPKHSLLQQLRNLCKELGCRVLKIFQVTLILFVQGRELIANPYRDFIPLNFSSKVFNESVFLKRSTNKNNVIFSFTRYFSCIRIFIQLYFNEESQCTSNKGEYRRSFWMYCAQPRKLTEKERDL